jgi:hypothetical protein
LDNILLDTGSALTVISIDVLSDIGIKPEPTDIIRTIRGVDGTEAVFGRFVDYIKVDTFKIEKFEIEVAGMDFLFSAGAIIDLHTIELNFTKKD